MKTLKLVVIILCIQSISQAQVWTDLTSPNSTDLAFEQIIYDDQNDLIYVLFFDFIFSEYTIYVNDGSSWSSICTTSGVIGEMIIDVSGNLVIVGNFNQLINGSSTYWITSRALWDGSIWSPLGTLSGDSDSVVMNNSGNLIFQNSSSTHEWDGVGWTTIATGNNGSGKLLIDQTGGLYLVSNLVQYWNGSIWVTIASVSGLDKLYAAAVDNNDHLIVGGNFLSINGVSANNVARWDGTAWNPMGNGLEYPWPLQTSIETLDVNIDGTIFAGGRFWSSGSSTIYNIASWNGTTWEAVGDGIPYVYDITHDDIGQIYISTYSAFPAGPPLNPLTSPFGRWEPDGPYKVETLVYADMNFNLTKDPGEPFVDQGYFNLITTAPYNKNFHIYQNILGEGRKAFMLPTVGPISFQNGPASYTPVINKNSIDLNVNQCEQVTVSLQPTLGSQDIAISIMPIGGREALVRPGFSSQYKITVTNLGTQIIASAQASLNLDGRQTFTSSLPSPSSVTGNTINWTCSNLAPFVKHEIIVTVLNDVIPSMNLGDNICNSVQITPITGDVDLNNNQSQVKQIAQGAYDPNDKQASNGGIMSSQQAADQEWIDYLIRFQNTGTDVAERVIVRDTLDDLLDGSTLELMSASHLNTMTVDDDKNIEWRFDNINLIDSIANEPLSHGYIQCRIKPKPGLVLGDQVFNNASIYFDFNPAIVTNNHEILVSDNAFAQEGPDHCLHFSGNANYVQCASPLIGNSDYTVEAWFFSENTFSNEFYRIIGWQGFECELADAGGTLRFFDNNVWVDTGVNVRDNNWHHVAVTRSGAQYKVYVDGVLSLDYTRNNTLNLSNPFRIGSKVSSGTGEFWTGLIDEVRIWDYARPADKITHGMHCSIDPSTTGLKAYYRFNQGTAAGNNTTITSLYNSVGSTDGSLQNFNLTPGTTSNWVVSQAQDANLCFTGSLYAIESKSIIGEEINFSYATTYNYTSLAIDFGDGTIAPISGPASFINHQYEIPGYYTASLLVDNQCVASANVLVQSCEWAGYTSDFSTLVLDEQFGSCQFIDGSAKQAFLDPADVNITDYNFHLSHFKNFGVTLNDVELAVDAQNTLTNGGLGDETISIQLIGSEGSMEIGLSNQVATTFLNAPGVMETGLAALQTTTSNFQVYKVNIQNNLDVDILINNISVHTFSMRRSLGDLYGISLKFHGSGHTEFVAIEDLVTNQIVYTDLFSSCSLDCPCAFNLNIIQDHMNQDQRSYRAHNNLHSDVVIPLNSDISYSAGNEINLDQAYEVNTMGVFSASIEVCDLFCNTEVPVHDLSFLGDLQNDYSIDHCTLNGSDVFYLVNCIDASDVIVFDCGGAIICTGTTCSTTLTLLDCIVLDTC